MTVVSKEKAPIVWQFSWPKYDTGLLKLTVIIALLGWLMIASASMDYAQHVTGNPYYFIIKHSLTIAIALIASVVVSVFPMSFWYRFSGVFLFAAAMLLILVLIPGIGHKVNGSYRWLDLGFYNLQPSELAKAAMILYLAGYLVRRKEEVSSSWWGFMKPMLVMGPIGMLVMLEPDMGTTLVILFSGLGMLFLGGVKLGQFLSILVSASAFLVLAIRTQDYRLRRILAYLDPWAPENVYGDSYQLTQALIAIGRGEYFGNGLGNSIQKLFYLPEAHTDFIFAIMSEETGLFGMISLIVLFGLLIWKIMSIGNFAMSQSMTFGAYISYGVALVFICQVFVNMSVNMGLLPTKGLTLPLFSYGGSSLLVTGVMLALVFRIQSEAKEACNE